MGLWPRRKRFAFKLSAVFLSPIGCWVPGVWSLFYCRLSSADRRLPDVAIGGCCWFLGYQVLFVGCWFLICVYCCSVFPLFWKYLSLENFRTCSVGYPKANRKWSVFQITKYGVAIGMVYPRSIHGLLFFQTIHIWLDDNWQVKLSYCILIKSVKTFAPWNKNKQERPGAFSSRWNRVLPPPAQ